MYRPPLKSVSNDHNVMKEGSIERTRYVEENVFKDLKIKKKGLRDEECTTSGPRTPIGCY